jgi:hypothetical protein
VRGFAADQTLIMTKYGIGQPVSRFEDPRLLRGRGRYQPHPRGRCRSGCGDAEGARFGSPIRGDSCHTDPKWPDDLTLPG